jgi:hypothetical protein
MRRIGWAIIAAIVFTTSSLTHAGENEEPRITQPIDIISTGGAGIASHGRLGMLFVNPAALGIGDQSDFSILKVGAMANWDLYDYYQIYNKLDTTLPDYGISGLDQADLAKLINLRAKVGLNGPLSLGYMGNGIGILLYNDFLTSFVIKQSAGIPYVDFGTYLDAGLVVGYGFQLPLPFFIGKFARLYAGVSIKYLNRVKYEDDRLNIVEAFDIGMSIANTSRGVYLGQNIGADAGLTLMFNDQISVGIVIKDFFSTGFTWAEYNSNLEKVETGSTLPISYFYPSLDIGSAFKVRWTSYVLSDINLYFDIVNSLDFSENYWLKLRIGAEATLIKLLILRVGLYEGYPTAGIGISLPLLKINAAFYTEELGELPGTLPQSTAMIDVEFVI